jgi:hypothetical protein
MAQQVQAKPKAGDPRAQRNPTVQQQIFKTSSAVSSAACGILNAYTKSASPYERRKFQSLNQSAHGGESIAKQRHSPIDHVSVNAIRGHAAAYPRLGFENQRLKTPIFQADRRAEPGNAASNYDHVCIAAC